jgi:hypothetical protein
MPATSNWAQMAAKNGVTSLLSRASLLGDLEADLERAGAVGRRLDRVFCDLGNVAEIARRLVDA